jgi:CIC family chloride channel protein
MRAIYIVLRYNRQVLHFELLEAGRMALPQNHAGDQLADFTMTRGVIGLSLLSLFVGAIGAVVAYALVLLINLVTNLAYYQRFSVTSASPAGNHLGVWAILVPVVGGLIIGLMARYGSPKIRGHGIPEALEAILISGSRVEPRVAVLKPISSAISIGTGGPFGAEGPIIMTGGAIGSLVARFFRLTSIERRILLSAGAAAGMAAIFGAPVAAVLLAIELLLFEWKPRSFIPVAVASVTAGAVRVYLLGPGPVFAVPPHAPTGPGVLVSAVGVGLLAGLLGGILTQLVYAFDGLFEKLPVHWMWWPAIGGLVVGIGGLIDPRVLGVGYDLIHSLLQGNLVGGVVLGLLVTKGLVWAIALGSGTSGGVLAPLLIVGGALGAFLSPWIPFGDAGLWAMVGMTATMGGTMRSPFAATIFALEVTHDLNVLPALFIGCLAAEAVTVLWLRRSILTEKVARRGHHLAYEYGVDPLDSARVGEVMDQNVVTIPATMTVAELSEAIGRGDPLLARRQGTPIVDAAGLLSGIITRDDILRALEKPDGPTKTVLEAGTREPTVAYPDETVRTAVDRMLRRGVGRLPVVSRENPRNVVGYLGRTGVLEARQRQLQDEDLREQSWSLRRGARS